MNIENGNLMLKNMAFTNVSVKRLFDLPNEVELSGSFDIHYDEINENEIKVIINYNASSFKGEIKVDVELQGTFCTVEVSDKNVKDYLLHVNSIAILFPYLRSQISIATTQPGIVPIQVPIVNAVALARAAGFNG